MLFLLTLLHFAVDGFCGASLAAHDQAVIAYADIVALYVLYDLIAFGGQWLAGLVLDHRPAWLFATLFLSLICLSLVLISADLLLSACLLGAGNCLFHAAAGTYILRSSQNFSEPGIFVSSGATGLALGLHGFVSPIFFLALCAGCVLSVLLLSRKKDMAKEAIKKKAHTKSTAFPLYLCLLLLLGCISLRSFGSGSGAAPFVLLFPCLFTIGKALGGIFCDRLGFHKTILVIFLASFLALQLEGLAGQSLLALVLNMTMPLTLRLAHLCFPNYPGLIFGLAAGCLLPGVFLRSSVPTLEPQALIVLVFLSLFAAGALAKRYGKIQL